MGFSPPANQRLPLAERRTRPVSVLQLTTPALQYPLPVSSSPQLGITRQMSPPPLSARTPTRPCNKPSQSDLDHFEALYRRFLNENDAAAGKAIDAILKDAPSAYRREYSDLQAKIREKYHRDLEKGRRKELGELMRLCESGSLLRRDLCIPVGSLDGLRSSRARAVRRQQLVVFLGNFAVPALVGPHPLCRSLYAVLLLQTLATSQGGGGPFLIEWDIQDEVFLEAGGPDFLREAIKLLKGYFGFEETVREMHSLSRQTSLASSVETTQETVEVSQTARRTPPIPPARWPQPSPQAARDRSASDPFTDSKSNTLTLPPSLPECRRSSELSSPSSDAHPSVPLLDPTASRASQRLQPGPHTLCTRTFTIPPYLTNPELKALLKLFPAFIRNPSPGRFTARPHTVESGLQEIVIFKGHGTLRLSMRPRDAGFNGEWLERLLAWFAALFG